MGMSGQTAEATHTASEIAAAVVAGTLAPADALAPFLDAMASQEEKVGAWHFLAPPEALRDGAAAAPPGPLAGVGVAVKDIFETVDMPTGNGIAAHDGQRTGRDATAVARLRAAGAIIAGKTVTTECAYGASGKTGNPHDPARTPGGSSSGSAAAVAAGMAPLAVGSQTAGSVIRPAGYCGVWAMKPSFGVIPRTGMLPLAPSLDHPGFFATSAADLALAIDVTSGDDGQDPASFDMPPSRLRAALALPSAPPRLGFARSVAWDEIDGDTQSLLEGTARALGAADLTLPPAFDAVSDAHSIILAAEAAHSLKHILEYSGGGISDMLRERIEGGTGIDRESYLEAGATIDGLRPLLRDTLAPFDAVITPATSGVAPEGLAYTGSRMQAMLWSTFGVPAINVPGLAGEGGLPIGFQVVGLPGDDAGALRAAAWVGQTIARTTD